MRRTIFCRKLQQELPALTSPPLPGPKGLELMQQVSQPAWDAWMEHQTRLINEKHLKVFQPEVRQYLHEQMEKFFNNDKIDSVAGYTPKTD